MTDNIDSCYKCKHVVPDTEKNKLIRCNTCSKNIHMNCNKMTGKNKVYFVNNPEKFDCRSCMTCNICLKLVASNHKGILCDLCNRCVHAKCKKFNHNDPLKHQNDENLQFFCSLCLRNSLPTLDLNDQEFDFTMKGIKYPEDSNIILTEKQLELTRKINNAIANGSHHNKNDDDDVDDEFPNIIDCKYYTIDSFNKQKFSTNGYFSLLHLNIHSVQFHIDELRPTL